MAAFAAIIFYASECLSQISKRDIGADAVKVLYICPGAVDLVYQHYSACTAGTCLPEGIAAADIQGRSGGGNADLVGVHDAVGGQIALVDVTGMSGGIHDLVHIADSIAPEKQAGAFLYRGHNPAVGIAHMDKITVYANDICAAGCMRGTDGHNANHKKQGHTKDPDEKIAFHTYTPVNMLIVA